MGVLRESLVVLDPVVRVLTSLLLLPQHASAGPAPHVRLRIVAAASECASEKLGLGGGLPVVEEGEGRETHWVVPREVERAVGHLGLSRAGLVLLAQCLEASRADLEASEASDGAAKVGRRGRKSKRGTGAVEPFASRLSSADLAVAHAIASLFAQQAETRLRALEAALLQRQAQDARDAVATIGASAAAAAWFGDDRAPPKTTAPGPDGGAGAGPTAGASAKKTAAAVLQGPPEATFPVMETRKAAAPARAKHKIAAPPVPNAWRAAGATGAPAAPPATTTATAEQARAAAAASNAPLGRRIDRRTEDDEDDLAWTAKKPKAKR
jgi:hypothetical protein